MDSALFWGKLIGGPLGSENQPQEDNLGQYGAARWYLVSDRRIFPGAGKSHSGLWPHRGYCVSWEI